MQITIFGASGKVGQLVVTEALQRNIHVKAFIHHNNPFTVIPPGLEICQGELQDVASIHHALEGSQAIICTLGSWGTKNKNSLIIGMQSIIPIAEKLNIDRLVSLTGTGARHSQDRVTIIARLHRLALQIGGPKILHDAEKHLALLTDSSLEWTVIRSPRMTDSKNKIYVLSDHFGSPFASISRRAIATCLVDQLNDKAFSKQAPILHTP